MKIISRPVLAFLYLSLRHSAKSYRRKRPAVAVILFTGAEMNTTPLALNMIRTIPLVFLDAEGNKTSAPTSTPIVATSDAEIAHAAVSADGSSVVVTPAGGLGDVTVSYTNGTLTDSKTITIVAADESTGTGTGTAGTAGAAVSVLLDVDNAVDSPMTAGTGTSGAAPGAENTLNGVGSGDSQLNAGGTNGG